MILVDSSVWIAYFNGTDIWQSEKLDQLLGKELIIVGDLILTEVLQGFHEDKDFNQAREFLSEFMFRELGGYLIAIQASNNYRLLRKQGITVRKTIDIIIATFCINENLLLLHNDRDFDPLVSILDLLIISSSY